jgi:hypothetical protein
MLCALPPYQSPAFQVVGATHIWIRHECNSVFGHFAPNCAVLLFLRGRCLQLILRWAGMSHCWSDQCLMECFMLALTRSLLNRDYQILINVLKVVASIISMCSLPLKVNSHTGVEVLEAVTGACHRFSCFYIREFALWNWRCHEHRAKG